MIQEKRNSLCDTQTRGSPTWLVAPACGSRMHIHMYVVQHLFRLMRLMTVRKARKNRYDGNIMINDNNNNNNNYHRRTDSRDSLLIILLLYFFVLSPFLIVVGVKVGARLKCIFQ